MTQRDTELAAAIARRHGLDAGAVRAISGEGFVNHVVVVGSGETESVVRFAIDPLRRDDFDIEAWCLQQALAAGLPTPTFIARGELDGVPYLVQSFVDGAPGTGLPPETAWACLGRYAALVRDIPLTPDAPDDLFSRFGRNLQSAWHSHVEYNLRELGAEDPLIGLGVYRPEDELALRNALVLLLSAPFEFGLRHGDLAPRNLLVPADGPPVLIDWGTASTGPAPWGDLEAVYRWHIVENSLTLADVQTFARECGIDLATNLPLLESMLVLSALDLVRWSLEQRPDLLDEYRNAATAAVRRFMNVTVTVPEPVEGTSRNVPSTGSGTESSGTESSGTEG